jgi:hypothetical protein
MSVSIDTSQRSRALALLLVLGASVVGCGARDALPLDDGVATCPAASESGAWARRIARMAKPSDNVSGTDDTAVAVDGAGDIIVGSVFVGAADFGCQSPSLTAEGDRDYLLAKLDSRGRLLWARRFGAQGHDARRVGVRVDGQGRIVFVGKGYGESFDLDGTTIPADGMFLASFTPSGDLRWAHGFDLGSSDPQWTLAVSSGGRILLAGGLGYDVGIDFGLGPLAAQVAETNDAYVSGWDPDGKPIYSRTFPGSESRVTAVAFTADEHAILAAVSSVGPFSGGQPFLAQIDGAGETMWMNTLSSVQPMVLALDASGAPILAGGSTDSSIALGYLARASTSGSLEVLHAIAGVPGFGNDFLFSAVAVSPSGSVSIAGSTQGTVDFGSGPVASAGDRDALLLSTDTSLGLAPAARLFGDAGYQSIEAMAQDERGALVIAGQTSSPFTFGAGLDVKSTCAESGCLDLFVARLAP